MSRFQIALLFLAGAVQLPCAPAQAQPADSAGRVRAAREILRDLQGQWSFEWRARDGSGPGFTGERVYRLLPDSLQLVWDETFTSGRQSAHGILWYHPRARQFFYVAVNAPTGSPVLLSGRLRPTGDGIDFEPVRVPMEPNYFNEGLVRSTLHVSGVEGHTWSRWDEGWIVIFKRAR